MLMLPGGSWTSDTVQYEPSDQIRYEGQWRQTDVSNESIYVRNMARVPTPLI